MKLEEQIENDDIFSDCDDNSNKELNIKLDINSLSNIKGKKNDNGDFNFLNSSSSYTSDLSKKDSSQNEYYEKKDGNKKRKKGDTSLNSDRICKQALTMTKFLGTLQMKKLDLKYELRQRKNGFLGVNRPIGNCIF